MTKRIVVTGGTGFVGRKLVEKLVARGDEVVVLARRANDPRVPAGARCEAWTPDAIGPWASHVDGARAVVHLAGEPVMGSRWTDEQKRRIRDSRVLSTRAIVDAIAKASSRPEALVCASAIGLYGPRPPEETLDESSSRGEGFLADVVEAWEEEAVRAESFGARVVRLRIGIVLGDTGGALAQMTLPFRFFVGGPVGSGEQIVSWIHLDDVVGLLLLAIDDPAAKGAVNATAPSPVSMRELARAIGRALHRPSFLPVPSLAVRVALGEAAEAVLTGQRVLPRAAERLGYRFRFTSIDDAVADAVR